MSNYKKNCKQQKKFLNENINDLKERNRIIINAKEDIKTLRKYIKGNKSYIKNHC